MKEEHNSLVISRYIDTKRMFFAHIPGFYNSVGFYYEEYNHYPELYVVSGWANSSFYYQSLAFF